MKLSRDDVYKMPVKERKAWIHRHNMDVEERNAELQQSRNKSKGNSYSGAQINQYAAIEQNYHKNAGLS